VIVSSASGCVPAGASVRTSHPRGFDARRGAKAASAVVAQALKQGSSQRTDAKASPLHPSALRARTVSSAPAGPQAVVRWPELVVRFIRRITGR
jgi:hypothetical protein